MEQFTRVDTNISRWLRVPPQSRRRQWARVVAHLGDGPLVFGGLGVVYLLSWIIGDSLQQTAQLVVFLEVVATMGIVTAIKFAVKRQRPAAPGEFATFQYDMYSFPSGHAARMAALAAGVLFFYPWLGGMLVCLTVTIGLARVAVGVHFFSDILAGLFTGSSIAWIGNVILVYLFL